MNPIVFDLMDELIDAFEADALHVGMDEVFLIGSEKCPRCKGKDVAELFAGVVNRLHQHLVKEKGVEMLMWGDRLLKSPEYGSKWEASKTGSHPAIDMVPKDIIICDWHYPLQDDYPSVRFFQEKGFRVLPATCKTTDAALALIRCCRTRRHRADAGLLVHRLVGRRRAPAGRTRRERHRHDRLPQRQARIVQASHDAAVGQHDPGGPERTGPSHGSPQTKSHQQPTRQGDQHRWHLKSPVAIS